MSRLGVWFGIVSPPLMGERSSCSDALVRVVDEKLTEKVETGGGGSLVLWAVAAARVEPLLEGILMSIQNH